MDWSRVVIPPEFKNIGGEFHGPCPIDGGKDACWVNPDKQTLGCRKCTGGSCKFEGDQLELHARAFGIWTDPDPKRRTRTKRTPAQKAKADETAAHDEALDHLTAEWNAADPPSDVDTSDAEQPSLTRGKLVMSEDELAEVFADELGRDWAYRPEHGWLYWKDHQWRQDRTLRVIGALMSFGRARWGRKTEEGIKRDPRGGGNRRVATGAETKLRSLLAVERWDHDPLLLGVLGGKVAHLDGYNLPAPDGTVHGSYVVRPRTRADRVTRTAGAAPATIGQTFTIDEAGALVLRENTWADFLKFALPLEVGNWLQAIIGYSASGLTSEELLIFCYGPSATGKGTFLTAVADALGEYSRRIDPDDLMAGVGEQHPHWKADLEGRRLVVADEVERGRQWATGRVKSLVSGEPIRARHMAKSFFEFRPCAQLVLAANHAPTMRSRDTGLVRRLLVVPFLNRPATVNRQLKQQIDRRQVMGWIASGAHRYFQNRQLPKTPDVVLRATEGYHQRADALAGFVADLPTGEWLERRDIAARYGTWVAAQDIRKPLSRQALFSTLREDYEARERIVTGQRQMMLPGRVEQHQAEQPMF